MLVMHAQFRMYRREKTPGECISFWPKTFAILAMNIEGRRGPWPSSASAMRPSMLFSPRKGMTMAFSIRNMKFRCSWMTSTEERRCGLEAIAMLYMHCGSSKELITTSTMAGSWLQAKPAALLVSTSAASLSSSQLAMLWRCRVMAGMRTFSCDETVTGVTSATIETKSRSVRPTKRTLCSVLVMFRFIQFTSEGCGARVQARVAEAKGGTPKLKYAWSRNCQHLGLFFRKWSLCCVFWKATKAVPLMCFLPSLMLSKST
mmetsp:Transcript_85512/g.250343  ORF Transcript_85512/g.250343 Transcript_85512/m.250343 type:complete len:260 (+) Transcript_85512:858-1637(+)